MLLCIHVAMSFKPCKRVQKWWKTSTEIPKYFLCSHLSTILDRNHEADLWLSFLSQLSMIVMFMPCINKSLLGKRLANVCSISIDDIHNGVSGIFLALLADFMKKMKWFKKAETKDLVKGLDEFAQKLDVVAIDWCKKRFSIKVSTTMLFLLWSLFRQWLNFLWRHNLISQHHCGMLPYGMLSFSHETYMLSTSNNWNLFLSFVIYLLWGHLWKSMANSRASLAPCLLDMSNTKSLST